MENGRITETFACILFTESDKLITTIYLLLVLEKNDVIFPFFPFVISFISLCEISIIQNNKIYDYLNDYYTYFYHMQIDDKSSTNYPL